MTREIARLHSFGVGTETTSGTANSTPSVWIPLDDGNLKPITTLVKDEGGYGVISAPTDMQIAEVSSEFDGKGIVRPTSFGWLLLYTLGTSSSPTLTETGVYLHSFSVQNTNTHPSFTVIHDNQTQEEMAAYHMVDSLEISGQVGDFARFTLKSKGQLQTSTSGHTPAFLTSGESSFKVSRASIKFASSISGLAGATQVACQNFKIAIAKNLEQIFSTNTAALTTSTDATNFAGQYNKSFEVKGDFEIVYDADTYKTLALAGTKQAIELQIAGTSLIGATQYENITIHLASVVLDSWDRKSSKDDLVTQTF